jgi:hypothetical protein
MASNRRKFVRRSIAYPARLVAIDESWGRDCHVVDVSDGGAKLRIEKPGALPLDFILALSMGGRSKATRRCHIVWSDGNEIGVKFEARRKA